MMADGAAERLHQPSEVLTVPARSQRRKTALAALVKLAKAVSGQVALDTSGLYQLK
jgi:hypothetical protein